jgi:hypothetical protein
MKIVIVLTSDRPEPRVVDLHGSSAYEVPRGESRARFGLS